MRTKTGLRLRDFQNFEVWLDGTTVTLWIGPQVYASMSLEAYGTWGEGWVEAHDRHYRAPIPQDWEDLPEVPEV